VRRYTIILLFPVSVGQPGHVQPLLYALKVGPQALLRQVGISGLNRLQDGIVILPLILRVD
jgi:hypothetical protein